MAHPDAASINDPEFQGVRLRFVGATEALRGFIAAAQAPKTAPDQGA
jgi:hypothetical protein